MCNLIDCFPLYYFTLDLPENWVYEKEQDDIEACFDTKSQCTLHIYLIQVKGPEGSTKEEKIKSLTGGLDYTLTNLGYFPTDSQTKETIEQNNKLTVFSWRLIQMFGSNEANVIILTYTVLTAQKDSEKEMIGELEKSFKDAIFV